MRALLEQIATAFDIAEWDYGKELLELLRKQPSFKDTVRITKTFPDPQDPKYDKLAKQYPPRSETNVETGEHWKVSTVADGVFLVYILDKATTQPAYFDQTPWRESA